jgi:hypothetical protein
LPGTTGPEINSRAQIACATARSERFDHDPVRPVGIDVALYLVATARSPPRLRLMPAA